MCISCAFAISRGVLYLSCSKLIDPNSISTDHLKSTEFKWFTTFRFLRWPSETATRSGPDHSERNTRVRQVAPNILAHTLWVTFDVRPGDMRHRQPRPHVQPRWRDRGPLQNSGCSLWSTSEPKPESQIQGCMSLMDMTSSQELRHSLA